MFAQDTSLPQLNGQRVLITGATGGIGSGIARQFAAAGAHLALHYRSSAATAETLAEELRGWGGTVVTVHADLSAPGAAAQLVHAAAELLNGLDGLVNNAGVQPLNMLHEMNRDEWDEVFHTNLGSVFELTQAAAAEMVRHKAEQNPHPNQWITHIASIEATRPAPAHAHYAAAKAGVVMHAKAAALELGGAGIRVNSVSPGLIERPNLETDWPAGVQSWQDHAPLGRLGTATDVGNACVLLASNGATFITGHDLVVDGGMLATPGW